jgi:hypothetical protein
VETEVNFKACSAVKTLTIKIFVTLLIFSSPLFAEDLNQITDHFFNAGQGFCFAQIEAPPHNNLSSI